MMKWLDRWKAKRARKLIVTFHMKSGKSISARCENLTIKKNSNELVAYEMTNINTRDGDSTFYICLEQVEEITTEKL